MLKSQFDDVTFRNVCSVSHWRWVMDYGWYWKICQVMFLKDQYLDPTGKLFGLDIEITRAAGRPRLAGPWMASRTIEPYGVFSPLW
jgi:hypothetical protein